MLTSGPYRKEPGAGFRPTTNNRMEPMTVIVGLETLGNNGSERSMPRTACRRAMPSADTGREGTEGESRLYLEHDFFWYNEKTGYLCTTEKTENQ